MRRTLVLNVVGLTSQHLGPHTPHLTALAEAGSKAPMRTIVPAVTCSVQSTLVTGALPRVHGCVGNGWYFRDLAQVALWRQSNHLVGGEKLWDVARARDGRFRCAKLFWWYNMYASVDVAVTPRPVYRADGIKVPDIHTSPIELRDELQNGLGRFPLFNFWGPRADIQSSRWIAECARRIEERCQPTLSLVYLPHLDYNLQRLGPGDPAILKDLKAIDDVCGDLIAIGRSQNLRLIVLSEYGIVPVSGPIHINRALRDAGLIAFREEFGEEHLDPGASAAFAVADHQIAHIYVRERAVVPKVKALLERLEGVERVLDEEGKRVHGLDHERSGELVAISRADRWFTYYWWLDDARAPDYARTVDIHAKPGYDPVELFINPRIPMPRAYVALRLFRRNVLRQRVPLDVISLDATLVRGSHGRPTDQLDAGPLVISSEPVLKHREAIDATDVKGLILDHLFS